jgi:hypothetical protein
VAHRRRRTLARVVVFGVAGAVTAAAVSATLSASTASADPSASDWHRLRVCESGDNYSINTGNGHYGAYQFDLPTPESSACTRTPTRDPAG